MPSYVASDANRFYTALESAYGQVPAITAAQRIPAGKLTVRQQREATTRQDKTGSRTFAGLPPGGRKRTQFQLNTYMTGWNKQTPQPAYGPLFQAALGAAPLTFAGAAAGAGSYDTSLVFSGTHGLAVGQAVVYQGEIRFVDAIVNQTTVILSAPFTAPPAAGAAIGATVTYRPATELGSTSLFDYWSPVTAVQRILCGAAMDQVQVQLNGDFHEFTFSGLAHDVLDSSSFESGQGQLQSFPAEPALGDFDYALIPGSLGQAWLGTTPARFCTVTAATLVLANNLDTRTREFGACLPRALSAGPRTVRASFEVFQKDDNATKALYQAARQESPISVMFQLGEVDGHVMGIWMRSVLLSVPEFNDGDPRVRWSFRESQAVGTVDDEIAVAFG
jgi:hypothetical protein